MHGNGALENKVGIVTATRRWVHLADWFGVAAAKAPAFLLTKRRVVRHSSHALTAPTSARINATQVLSAVDKCSNALEITKKYVLIYISI